MKFVAFAFLLLVSPVLFVLLRNDVAFDAVSVFLAAAGFGALFYAIGTLLKPVHARLAAALVTALLLSSLFIRVLMASLFEFSGRGFSSEFFGHFELKSFQIAFGEHSLGFVLLLLVLVATAFITFKLLNRRTGKPLQTGGLALLFALGLIYAGSSASPEILLVRAYQHYHQQLYADLAKDEVRAMTSTLLEPLKSSIGFPVEKSQLEVSLPTQPVNLILVYLESFSEMLTENEDYPDLTPRLDAMKRRFKSDQTNYSSAYVTIEGIANSQCGTLMNMDYANNSLTTAKGRLPALPCLGDILHEAGYKQVYLGGSGLEFAGKGAFLNEHGYDEVLGWEHWLDGGYRQTENLWGLPDTILFDEAFDRIRQLQSQSIPFNLTMLTLGTHLPGFQYDGCPEYTGVANEAFLNGIHCTDYLVGKFVDQLEAQGVLGNSVLLIQGDHGIFPNPEMKRLFADGVNDKRILTIMSVPESEREWIQPAAGSHISTVDTVATLLDVMQIKHNVDFILARSKFDPERKPAYLLTRYDDYDQQGKKIHNNPAVCNETGRTGPLSLPLDHCDKGRALQAVYAMDATYTFGTSTNSQVCDMAVETFKHPKTGKIFVRWGNRDLTDKFNHIGRAVNSKMRGIYLLLLDESDEVLQQQFFAFDSKTDLEKLQEMLRTSDTGQHVLLLTNVSTDERDDTLAALWPDLLEDNYLVYGVVDSGKVRAELVDAASNFARRFYPDSCVTGLQQLTFDAPYKARFCKINKWGPNRAYVGKRFNEQADGRSALWFKTECAPKNLVILLNGEPMETTQHPDIITAALNVDHLLEGPGEYQIEFQDPETGDVKEIGVFRVLPVKAK